MTDYKSSMTFSYSGWGRNVSMTTEDDDADFLPKVLDNVADFLRSVGFVYVGVRKEGKTYVFHHEYDWKDPSLGEAADSDIEELLKGCDDDQEEAVEAASDYWDKLLDDAYGNQTLTSDLTVGDEVFYHGRGTSDASFGHNGFKGVSLVNMRGKVIDIKDSPIGKRVLIKVDNWFDGHNGFGSDPDAPMKATNYWWTDANNLSR